MLTTNEPVELPCELWYGDGSRTFLDVRCPLNIVRYADQATPKHSERTEYRRIDYFYVTNPMVLSP
jgi:hypothetical protein